MVSPPMGSLQARRAVFSRGLGALVSESGIFGKLVTVSPQSLSFSQQVNTHPMVLEHAASVRYNVPTRTTSARQHTQRGFMPVRSFYLSRKLEKWKLRLSSI